MFFCHATVILAVIDKGWLLFLLHNRHSSASALYNLPIVLFVYHGWLLFSLHNRHYSAYRVILFTMDDCCFSLVWVRFLPVQPSAKINVKHTFRLCQGPPGHLVQTGLVEVCRLHLICDVFLYVITFLSLSKGVVEEEVILVFTLAELATFPLSTMDPFV